ncbi:cupin domain-containing protein [Jiangella muralis]|uniref:cupin domain-containing protein n=1 Tax=Jiangella muralis TaxID=702383 RepID=UPI00069DF7FE|nr:cupin domain-containing protein [Jiangella muralis]
MRIQRRGEQAITAPQVHDGPGELTIDRYFAGVSRLPVSVHVWEFPPGAGEGPHTHDDDDALAELYLVVRGSVRVTAGDETAELHEGDALYAAPGEPHGVLNHTDRPATLVLVWGPPAVTGPGSPTR